MGEKEISLFDSLESNEYEGSCFFVFFLQLANYFTDDILLLFLNQTIQLYKFFNFHFPVLIGRRELFLFEPFCDPFGHLLFNLLHFKIMLL